MSQFDLEDLPTNLSDNEHFHSIVERVISRRGFLKLGAGASAAAFLGGMLSACGGSSSGSNPASASSLLGFKPVEKYTGAGSVGHPAVRLHCRLPGRRQQQRRRSG